MFPSWPDHFKVLYYNTAQDTIAMKLKVGPTHEIQMANVHSHFPLPSFASFHCLETKWEVPPHRRLLVRMFPVWFQTWMMMSKEIGEVCVTAYTWSPDGWWWFTWRGLQAVPTCETFEWLKINAKQCHSLVCALIKFTSRWLRPTTRSNTFKTYYYNAQNNKIQRPCMGPQHIHFNMGSTNH